MSHSAATFCSVPEHNSQPIRYLCLEEACRAHRLICHFCVRDSHRKHSLANLEKYIEPLARLGMNSQHPLKDTVSSDLEGAVTSLSESWERVSELVVKQSKFLEDTVLFQLNTLASTFSEGLVETAENKMSAGTASEEEVEDYVRKINFLGGKNFNDPQQLATLLALRQKSIEQVLQELLKKLNSLFSDFQNKIKRLSFENIEAQPNCEKPRDICASESKESRESVELEPLRKPIQEYSIRDQPSESQQRDTSEDVIKLESDDSAFQANEVHIGLDNQDGIAQMTSEARARVRRVVVGCCRNPEAQLAKLLSLGNLEELEIYWYELGRKECLVRLMNALPHLRVLVLNCANEFDEECCRLAPKRLPKLRKLEYGWDFYNSLREYDEHIYFRVSPFTSRGCPLKTSVTREMAVGLRRLENVWLGDFMYFRPSNCEIPFRQMREFTLGQAKGKYFRIPDKLTLQLKDMRHLLSLAILRVKIDEKKLFPILLNNRFLKTFVVEGCEDITDESLRILARNCNLLHLSIRESKVVEGLPIAEMTNLATLVLVECSSIRPSELMVALRRMPFLTYLNLYGNSWADDRLLREIPAPDHFQAVNLGRTAITDATLECLANFTSLKSLCLDCNKLTGAAIVRLARQVTGLQKISLWGLNGSLGCGLISDDELSALGRELPFLQHISIRFCKQLNGSTFLEFGALRFVQADRETLALEVQGELEKRGVKLLLDLEKQAVQDDV